MIIKCSYISSSLISIIWCLLGFTHAQVKVAVFHPLIIDWVEQVGGEHVTVISMLGGAHDLHKFEPNAKAIQQLEKTQLWVFSGKGLEHYRADLEQQLRPNQVSLELGRLVPTRRNNSIERLNACCDIHGNVVVDPHWWHRVDYVERAIKVLSKNLQELDSANKDSYKANEKAYLKKLKELEKWVKLEIAKIPKKQRYLATDHAAFGYFCDAYGFKPLFLSGMTSENHIASKHLLEHINILKKYQIKAVFSEQLSNTKMLEQIAQEIGTKLGSELIADGDTDTYEGMMRSNVNAIVQGLAG